MQQEIDKLKREYSLNDDEIINKNDNKNDIKNFSNKKNDNINLYNEELSHELEKFNNYFRDQTFGYDYD